MKMGPDLEKINFPLYSLYVSPDFIRLVMETFSEFPSRGKLEGMRSIRDHILFIDIDYESEKNFLMLSDYFNQLVRMKSSFLNNITPYDYFQQKRKEIIYSIGQKPDYENIYGYLWKKTRMCSTFPITVVKATLEHFKPRSVFDPCAGWGDRMLACMAQGVPYTGIDPNRELIGGYSRMIDILNKDPKDYVFVSTTFEEYSPGEKKYDLIFTSPPFFDMEKYSDEPSQSIERFPSYDLWKKNFLFPMVLKSLLMLEEGGHLVLYVNNIKKYPIFDDVMFHVKRVKQFKNIGKISWKNTKYPKTMFVITKV